MTLNDLLEKSKDRMTFFAGSRLISSEPDTKPRRKSKRDRVLALEMQLIKNNVDMSKFSRPSQELIDGWKLELGKS